MRKKTAKPIKSHIHQLFDVVFDGVGVGFGIGLTIGIKGVKGLPPGIGAGTGFEGTTDCPSFEIFDQSPNLIQLSELELDDEEVTHSISDELSEVLELSQFLLEVEDEHSSSWISFIC